MNEFNAPMTPEMQQAMMVQQQMPQPQMQQQAPVPAPQELAPSSDDIAQAKKMLGLDVLEENMKYDKSVASTLQDFPELTKGVIEQELAKVAEKDPEFAKQIRTSEEGMKMFAKGLMPSIKPNAKPDNVTDDTTSSAQGGEDEDLETRVKKGTATQLDVGKYIGQFKKSAVKK